MVMVMVMVMVMRMLAMAMWMEMGMGMGMASLLQRTYPHNIETHDNGFDMFGRIGIGIFETCGDGEYRTQ